MAHIVAPHTMLYGNGIWYGIWGMAPHMFVVFLPSGTVLIVRENKTGIESVTKSMDCIIFLSLSLSLSVRSMAKVSALGSAIEDAHARKKDIGAIAGTAREKSIEPGWARGTEITRYNCQLYLQLAVVVSQTLAIYL